MCGIFAWSGKDPKKFNKDKFDKLGMFNIDRGKDSCGVSYDGEIYYGTGTEKLYSKFIVDREINPLKYPVVIGHTRQASVGNIVNETNAHPFGFGTNADGNYAFIGCHNGTLYNHKDLAKEYGVSTFIDEEKTYSVSPYNKYTIQRQKIDSEILLEIIYTNKNFKVLGKYNGGAALVFTDTNEPNIVYVWKGASKMYDYASAIVEEERPLFYYKETKNSLYISSIQESLETIGGKANKNLFTFKTNNVYKITDGDIENAELIPITRVNSTQKEKTVTNAYSSSSRYHDGYWEDVDYDYVKNNHQARQIVLPAVKEHLNLPHNSSNCKIVAANIYNEALLRPQNDYKGRVYFQNLRYKSNGHLITGIYTWVNNYGFFKIGEESVIAAQNNLENCLGLPFIKNGFIKNTGDLDLTHEEVLKFIPFTKKTQIQNNIHYFIDGVKIQTALDYTSTYARYNESHIKKGVRIDHIVLSEASCHPVIDLSVDGKSANYQGIKLMGKLVEELMTCFPLGAEKMYSIEKGNLISYKKNDLLEKNLFGTTLFNSIDTIEDLIKYVESVNNSKESSNDFKELLEFDNIDYTNKISDELITEEEEIVLELIEENIDEIFVSLDNLIEESQAVSGNSDRISKRIEKLKVIRDYVTTINIEENE